MMLYVFDTDMLTLYQEGHPEVCRRVVVHRPDELATTIISVEEQVSGWFTMLRRPADRKTLARTYQRMTETVSSGIEAGNVRRSAPDDAPRSFDECQANSLPDDQGREVVPGQAWAALCGAL
jgi:hypothetical protein